MDLIYVTVFLLVSPLVLSQTVNDPYVTLNVGTVVGKYETVYKGSNAYTVKSYLGIPYAKPPTGNLRFEKTEPLDMLDTNPYDATFYRPICPQMLEFMASTHTEDENCLFLNVFVPESMPDGPGGYAVMVWVHGGAFYIGASNDYDGAYLAATGNVVVVTINYRLGLLGFLTTKDENASGNYGLYDQSLAFQWVHDNIGFFMGDNKRVTVFGESAGAMSLSFQALYDKNYGRFQRVITQSGAAFMPYINMEKETSLGVLLIARNLDCPVIGTQRTIECLKEVPWKTMKDKVLELQSDPKNAVLLEFPIVIDGDMVKHDPKRYPHEFGSYVPDEVAFFRSLDFLSGINQFEGGLFLPVISGVVDFTSFQPTQEDMLTNHIGQVLMGMYNRWFREEIMQAVLHEYSNWTNPYHYESIRLQFVKALGDTCFAVPAVRNAMLHLDGVTTDKTYMYQFMPVTSERPPFTVDWLPGADHSEEVLFLFSEKSTTSWEQALSEKMIKYWTNFAKSGNPNHPVYVDVEWPSYNKSHQAYLELNTDMGEHSRRHYLATKEANFWLNVLPGLVAMETDTGSSTCYTTDGSYRWTGDFVSLVFALSIYIVAVFD